MSAASITRSIIKPTERLKAKKRAAQAKTLKDITGYDFSTDIADIRSRIKKRGGEIRQEEVEAAGRSIFINLIYVILAICIGISFTTFLFQPMIVRGISMSPTYGDGNLVVLNKFEKDYERFDVVHIVKPDGGNYIKRIIGLPGETVRIDKYGRVFINGRLLQEPYDFDPMEERGVYANPVTLGTDEYFCLGDNRNYSEDSRWEKVGAVKWDEISGEVVMSIFPFSTEKK